MVKISRDNTGKTRVAKGDKSGLGGQYAPDPAKIETAKRNAEELTKLADVDPIMGETYTAVYNSDETVRYEIWAETELVTEKLSYAPTFNNESAAQRWAKEFMDNTDAGDGIRNLEIVGVRHRSDGSFAGYVDPTGEISFAEGIESDPVKETMTVQQMVDLIRKEWSDAMSDNGAIWKKTNDELAKAKTQYPGLFEKAFPIAKELGRGF